ncbi:TPA: hypothetical protein N0F65_000624 [Lagenidium giganteum]|uniref:Mediator complex subunit 15 KIX domain-containing protein n=1 Tax=Lagenidium giganteum TaxID=4803 RepID=A0AAV2YNZ0_9STRA|nr:TPA: hypothetical protein N0F65_000624 [Lagenidium giganteum]
MGTENDCDEGNSHGPTHPQAQLHAHGVPQPTAAVNASVASVELTTATASAATTTAVSGATEAEMAVVAAASSVMHGSGAAAENIVDGEVDEQEEQQQRQWRRQVGRSLREELVRGMLEELQRISGQDNLRHLRMCASRYESFVWRKSSNQDEYMQKIERRIQSLRRQPSREEILSTAAAAAAAGVTASRAPAATEGHRECQRSRSRHSSSNASSSSNSSSNRHRSSGKSGRRSRHSHRHSTTQTTPATAASDESYFARLTEMKDEYRDEVALVFRELCRVNTVIQHSATLRRHESNNLGDFLTNLKKIIHLLEQQPDEAWGMIPARKRTLDYLDIVEDHIQRKVLPILHRLRHTYSTILTPIILNYLKNSVRFSRRL